MGLKNDNAWEMKWKQIASVRADKMSIQHIPQEDTEEHDHQFFELVYITQGQAMHTLNGNATIIRRGDFFVMDYSSVHGYAQSRNLRLINCLFLPEILDNTLAGCEYVDELMRVCLVRYHKQYLGQSAANRIFHDDDGRVLELLEGMQREFEEKNTGYAEVFRCRLLEILILTMRKLIRDEKQHLGKNPQSTVVLEAMQYLETNYCQKAVLGDFCREYHYSLQYISRRFKQETGLTALEYLQKKRLEKSCELLSGSDLSVQEIAREVGYEDVKFFQQLFRRKLKMSPREYRKMLLSP